MKKYHLFKININFLNVFSLVILVVVLLFTYIFFNDNFIGMFNLFNDKKIMLLLFPMMIFYFILHEFFHALGYIIHGADKSKITFGMELEKGVFYCLCKQDIKKKTILFSLMYPLFFIGFVTYVISIILNLDVLLLLSIVNISGAAGDIMYFFFIIKLNKEIVFSELDDGTSFVIKNIDDINKYKYYGLNYEGKVNSVSRSDFKRLYVSKLSSIVLVICFILLIFAIMI